MSRRKSRQIVLQTLYRNEFHSSHSADRQNKPAPLFLENSPSDGADKTFILETLKGVKDHKKAIDMTIREHTENWRQERVSLVDWNIMRIAVFEMLFCPHTPDKAALNEALILAKKFGEEKSVSFINGILNQVFKNRDQLLNRGGEKKIIENK